MLPSPWDEAIKVSISIGEDRIFTTKLGLSKALRAQEETPNLSVSLKGYPKKFWGLLRQKAHKTQQVILFHPKRRVYP